MPPLRVYGETWSYANNEPLEQLPRGAGIRSLVLTSESPDRPGCLSRVETWSSTREHEKFYCPNELHLVTECHVRDRTVNQDLHQNACRITGARSVNGSRNVAGVRTPRWNTSSGTGVASMDGREFR